MWVRILLPVSMETHPDTAASQKRVPLAFLILSAGSPHHQDGLAERQTECIFEAWKMKIEQNI